MKSIWELSFERFKTSVLSRLFEAIINTLSTVFAYCFERQLTVLGIGVAAPGLIDATTGVVVEADNLGWHDFPLAQRLRQQFEVHVVVEHDVSAAAYGEYLYGKSEGVHHMLYVLLGIGIGCGLILDGQVYSGSGGLAGELGHITVNATGQRCVCGKMGCLETIASGRAIVLEYRKRLQYVGCGNQQEALTADVSAVIAHAEQGRELALQVLTQAGQAIGVAIGNQTGLFVYYA